VLFKLKKEEAIFLKLCPNLFLTHYVDKKKFLMGNTKMSMILPPDTCIMKY